MKFIEGVKELAIALIATACKPAVRQDSNQKLHPIGLLLDNNCISFSCL